MTVRLCTFEHLLSTADGLGVARTWFPRVAAERFLTATKDGEIKRSPDPVPTIVGDLGWHNRDDADVDAWLQIVRGPRSIVTQNPSTVLIHDAWSWAVSDDPTADYPSVSQETTGGRMQVDRPQTAAKDLKRGRLFLDFDSSQVWVPLGVVPAGESVHVRYVASVQTPGVWTIPSEFEPRWEAHARWARLLLLVNPVGAR